MPQATGATVEWAHPGLASPLDVWNAIACGDNTASEGPLLASGLVGDDARALIEEGYGLSVEAVRDGAQPSARDRDRVGARSTTRYDLLLTPTMECVAFPLSDWAPRELDGEPIGEFYDDYCHFCYPFNLTGQPVVSVPMAPGSSGLPLGLQIAGRRFEDDLVLRAAAAWERAQPWEIAVARPGAARARPCGAARRSRGGRAASRRSRESTRGRSAAPVRARRAVRARRRPARRAPCAPGAREPGELEVSFQVEG